MGDNKNNHKSLKTYYIRLIITSLIIIIGIGILIYTGESESDNISIKNEELTYSDIDDYNDDFPEVLKNEFNRLAKNNDETGLKVFKVNNDYYLRYQLTERNTGGTYVSIEDIHKNGNDITVTTLQTETNGIVSMAFTTPYTIVKLDGDKKLDINKTQFIIKSSKEKPLEEVRFNVKSPYDGEKTSIKNLDI